MYKFLFGFSVVVFMTCLMLIIKTIGWDFNWLSLIVAVLGMVSACLSMWTALLIKKVKE